MDSLNEIRTMNALRPAGYWKTRIGELCDRVEELEKVLKSREKTQEGGQETLGGAVAPLFESGPPSDDELIAFLRGRPGVSLAQICGRFGVMCQYTSAHRSPEGRSYGYTDEARVIRNQLQRLRRAGKLRTEGQRWMI